MDSATSIQSAGLRDGWANAPSRKTSFQAQRSGSFAPPEKQVYSPLPLYARGEGIPNGSLWKGEQWTNRVKGGQRIPCCLPPSTSVGPAVLLATVLFSEPLPGPQHGRAPLPTQNGRRTPAHTPQGCAGIRHRGGRPAEPRQLKDLFSTRRQATGLLPCSPTNQRVGGSEPAGIKNLFPETKSNMAADLPRPPARPPPPYHTH